MNYIIPIIACLIVLTFLYLISRSKQPKTLNSFDRDKAIVHNLQKAYKYNDKAIELFMSISNKNHQEGWDASTLIGYRMQVNEMIKRYEPMEVQEWKDKRNYNKFASTINPLEHEQTK